MSKTMAEVLAEHQPSRWRSVTNQNEILRCCKQDFGNLTRKATREDSAQAWAAFTAHQTEMLEAAGVALAADANAKVQELAKRLLNEGIIDSLDILDRLASGDLKLIGGEA